MTDLEAAHAIAVERRITAEARLAELEARIAELEAEIAKLKEKP